MAISSGYNWLLAAVLATLIIAARAPACFSGETPDSGAAVP